VGSVPLRGADVRHRLDRLVLTRQRCGKGFGVRADFEVTRRECVTVEVAVFTRARREDPLDGGHAHPSVTHAASQSWLRGGADQVCTNFTCMAPPLRRRRAPGARHLREGYLRIPAHRLPNRRRNEHPAISSHNRKTSEELRRAHAAQPPRSCGKSDRQRGGVAARSRGAAASIVRQIRPSKWTTMTTR
jgi:hypothetical protein